jgi:5-methylcytosine-specific restriction protein B
MNTADRSIALIDTALRRRFEFKEMMPDYDDNLLKTITVNNKEINLKEMLIKMNERIEFLYDRDHQIGHAYFLEITDYDGLCKVFANKIIPLLQEYFYDDWEKIRLVLADNPTKTYDEQLIQIKKSYDSNDAMKELFGTEPENYDDVKTYKINPALYSNNIQEGAFTKIYKKSNNEKANVDG